MLEIRYVTLPSGPFPILLKPRSTGPKWPYAQGFGGLKHRNTEENMKKKSSVLEPHGLDA